jgi:5-formyltetrahydrofolate cyclo-ligase
VEPGDDRRPAASGAETAEAKQAIRERVWERLRSAGAARFPGARGRIPNFAGAEAAAARLAQTGVWGEAPALKSNPDAPQLPVRVRALQDGIVVFMAVPRLREPEPFLALDPATLHVPPRTAASIGGSARHGAPRAVGNMPRIGLIVCGSVAVNRDGARLGKGGGYSDLEFGLLREVNLVDDSTVIVTTVHPIQILDEAFPKPTTTSAST